MPIQLFVATVLALGLAHAPLSAQALGLTAPGHGDDVYFAIDLPLKGTSQPEQGRIFKIGQTTPVSVVAEVQAIPLPTLNSQCGKLCISNFYDLSVPDLSRDETLLLYVAKADCAGLCMDAVPLRHSVLINSSGRPTSFFGAPARLSGNGRFVASAISATEYFGPYAVGITDLQTGMQLVTRSFSNQSVQFGTSGRVVGDDGTLVFTANNSIYIYHNGQWIDGPNKFSPSDAVIDAAGKVVIYQALAPASYYQLRYFYPDTKEEGGFLKSNGNVAAPSLSMDGKRVAFQSNAKFDGIDSPTGTYQIYIVNIDGTGLRALSRDPDGVAEYTLSDDGETAWYVSTVGAIYHLNTETGETSQHVPPTCGVYPGSGGTPGSAISLLGSCLAEASVRIDGIATPIISRSTGALWTQIPWEVHVSPSIRFEIDTGSPFNLAPFPLDVRAISPGFVAQPIHQDFNAFVQPANPARAGEVLHFYATGLGPVHPPVATGVPGPSSPVSLVDTPVDCSLPVIFAGLAPSLIGFYQVSIQIPAGASVSQHVQCMGTSFDIPVVP